MLKMSCHTDDQSSSHHSRHSKQMLAEKRLLACCKQESSRPTQRQPHSKTKTTNRGQQLGRASRPKQTNMIPTANKVCQLAGIALNLILLIVHNELRPAEAYRFTIQHDLSNSAASNQPSQQSHQVDLFRPLVEQHQQQQESQPQMNFQYAPEQQQQNRRSSDETAASELLSASSSESLTSADQQQEQHEDESEAQQLRQLHQVVDTVAHLLNEEEEQRRLQAKSQSQPGPLPQMAALQSSCAEDFQLATAASEPQSQQQEPQQRQEKQVAPSDGLQLQPVDGQQSDGQQETTMPAEMMSESAIRQAIEELERVQQQERQRQEQQQQAEVASAESSQKPIVVAADDSQNLSQRSPPRQASSGVGLESLLDELGDQFMSDHQSAGGQVRDTERIEPLRLQPAQRESGGNRQLDSKRSDASIVTASSNDNHQARETRESGPASSGDKQQVSPQAQESLSVEASSVSESEQPHRPSLVMGQLDSVDSTSDLNSALTNDFYSFHAESIGAQSAAPSAPSPSRASNDLHQDSTNLQLTSSQSLSSSPSSSSSGDEQRRVEKSSASGGDQQQQESAPKPIGEPDRNLAPQNDLDSAAQTRSGQRQEFGLQPFDEGRNNLPNIDFSQQAPPPSGDISNQLVRSFRPQPVAPTESSYQQLDGANQFQPSSTLLPFSADNFWRPSSSAGSGAQSNTDDIGQQYNRARQDPAVVGLPPLPPTRFQSLTSPAPFLQPQPQPIGYGQAPGGQQGPPPSRPGHTHFTGHSFLPADPFGHSQQNGASRAQHQQQLAFTSTPQPIISVISGGESVGSNSVSWNPPPAINPPIQQQAPSHTFSTLAPPPGPGLSQPNSGPSVPIRSDQLSPQAQFGANQQHSFRPLPSQQFYPARDNNGRDFGAPSEPDDSQPTEPSTSTTTASSYSQSASPSPANQWSPFVSSSSPPFPVLSVSPLKEREVADSRPRSTVGTFAANGNGQRPGQFLPPSSGAETGFATTLPSAFSSANPIERQPKQFNSNGPQTSAAPFAPMLTGFGPSTQASTSPSRNVGALATTTPSTLDPSATTNSTKKDDMVIYYYYYYDDNKNATVVAKNISANAPAANINGASIVSDSSMDGDGGIEDTPYMDDPVAPANLASSRPAQASSTGTSSQRPQPTSTSTTTTTTTTPTKPTTPSTTRLTTTPASIRSGGNFGTSTTTQASGGPFSNSFELPKDKLRFPESMNKPRVNSNQRQQQPANRLTLSGNNTDDDVSDAELDQFQNDQQRPPFTDTNTVDSRRPPPGSRSAQVDQFVSSSPPSVLSPFSSSSTFRPGQRNQPAVHSSNQFTASPNTRQQAPANLHETRGRHQQAVTQAPPPPQVGNPVQGRQVAPSSAQQNNRASLSNASRYGTSTSSQFLEPYGMDPAAPATIAHHSGSDSATATVSHQRQPPSTSFSPGAGHQINKKPSPSPFPPPQSIVDSVLASTGAQLTAGNSGEQEQPAARQPAAGGRLPSVAQHFSPQRQSQPQQQQQPNAPPSGNQQRQSPTQTSSGQTGQRPQSAQLSSTRQFFPESSSSQLDRAQPARNVQQVPAPSRQPVAPTRSQPSSTTTTSTTTTTQQPIVEREPDTSNSLDSDSKLTGDEQERNLPRDLVRDGAQSQAIQPRRPTPVQAPATSSQPGNGRPPSIDGNTSNGFTRAPPVSSSPSMSSTLASVGQRIQAQPLAQFQSQSARQASNELGSGPPTRAAPKSSVMATSQSAPTRPAATSPASPASVSAAVAQQASPSSPQVPQTTSSQFSSPPSIATTLISSTPQSQQQPIAASSTNANASSTTSTTTTTSTTSSSSSSSTSSTTQTPQGQDAASTESSDASASSTRRKFGNRNNRFQTRLSASRAASPQQVGGGSSSTSTTRPPQVFGSSSTTTRRPVSSTTRKSSKQLFAGRRRLSGSDTRTSGGSAPSSSPVDDSGTQQGAVQSSSPSSVSLESASPVSASRAKFGNNFMARSRSTTSTSTTSAPITTTVQQSQQGSGAADSSQLESTAKPAGLFATQRVTFKPRLSLLRNASTQKLATTSETVVAGDSSTAGASSSGASSDSTSSETAAEPSSGATDQSSSPVPPTGRSGGSSSSESTSSVGSGQAEPVDSSEQSGAANSTAGTETSAISPAVVGSTSTETSTTASSVPSVSAGTGNSKPKRPLFASRQRSSTLFGNRRSSGTNATTTTTAA